MLQMPGEAEQKSHVFLVHSGENYPQVAHRLEKQELIHSARVFRWYVRWHSFFHKNGRLPLLRGEYVLHPRMSLADIVHRLKNGSTIINKLTIPEGNNKFQIAEELEAQSLGSKKEFLKWVEDRDFIREMKLPTFGRGNSPPSSLEGYLYPDTYFVEKNMPEKELVRTMVKRFKEVYSSVREDMEKSPTRKRFQLSEHELIILASIVEKETGAGFERPLIAGVFYNRLRKKMRLESDPTVIYGMWERDKFFKGNIRRKDLRRANPYNTYTIAGLPKGPVSNPGINALRAVLYPKPSEYLFFVSRNDGTHVFSKKYSDHKKAVFRLQKRYRARKGKSWRDLPKELRVQNK